MAYQLQKLNVVKTVERTDHRDALLAQGFMEITEKVKKQPLDEKKSDDKNDTKTPDDATAKGEGQGAE